MSFDYEVEDVKYYKDNPTKDIPDHLREQLRNELFMAKWGS